MKATLIKKAEGWYNLYQDNIGIGSTHAELQGYKLSKQNCDEIFGVVVVEKLAEEEFPYDFDCPLFETLGVTEKSHKSILIGMLQGTLIKGFNKAMELNKDKQFTLGDVRNAMDWIMTQYFEFHEQPTTGRREHYLESLQKPTEIEVEIEMEEYGYCEGCRRAGMWHCAHADTCGQNVTLKRPKLDENGCLILTKAEQ